MATCEICKKSGQSGNNVSHSKRRTRTRWSANVQRAQVFIDGQQTSVKICTRCLRTHNKQMANN
ncbi:MAG: 50S ribosomal protein L28 [SAR202 cluster bacterium]|nr:50S ribosomal protein L28 [SAR202 cluster bacterium]